MTTKKQGVPQLEFEPPTNGNAELQVQPRSDAAVMLSPLPRDFLIRMQKFQKSIDRPPQHVIEESIGGERFKHLPISYCEHLLKKVFFGLYEIKVLQVQMIVNEVVVTARVRVFHPVAGVWLEYDGVGAIPVLQDAGTKVEAFIQSKKRKAIALNMPAAYAIAIKNACKKIGKIFGADLNRKHEDNYIGFELSDDKKPLNE
jgi:hypothetical protein